MALDMITSPSTVQLEHYPSLVSSATMSKLQYTPLEEIPQVRYGSASNTWDSDLWGGLTSTDILGPPPWLPLWQNKVH